MSKLNIEVTFTKIEVMRNEPFQKQKTCFMCDKNSTHYVRINYIDDGGCVHICGNCIKKIYNKSDKAINKIYKEGKKQSLEGFGKIYKKLGTKFDYFIFESQVIDLAKKIVEQGLKKGIFFLHLS